jgi:hypothetical protein
MVAKAKKAEMVSIQALASGSCTIGVKKYSFEKGDIFEASGEHSKQLLLLPYIKEVK